MRKNHTFLYALAHSLTEAEAAVLHDMLHGSPRLQALFTVIREKEARSDKSVRDTVPNAPWLPQLHVHKSRLTSTIMDFLLPENCRDKDPVYRSLEHLNTLLRKGLIRFAAPYVQESSRLCRLTENFAAWEDLIGTRRFHLIYYASEIDFNDEVRQVQLEKELLKRESEAEEACIDVCIQVQQLQFVPQSQREHLLKELLRSEALMRNDYVFSRTRIAYHRARYMIGKRLRWWELCRDEARAIIAAYDSRPADRRNTQKAVDEYHHAVYQLGMLHVVLGQWEEATQSLSALQQDNASPLLRAQHLNLALNLMRETLQEEEGRRFCRETAKFLRAEAENIPVDLMQKLLNDVARFEFWMGEPEAAVQWAHRNLVFSPVQSSLTLITSGMVFLMAHAELGNHKTLRKEIPVITRRLQDANLMTEAEQTILNALNQASLTQETGMEAIWEQLMIKLNTLSQDDSLKERLEYLPYEAWVSSRMNGVSLKEILTER